MNEIIGYVILLVVFVYQAYDKYTMQRSYEKQLRQINYDRIADAQAWEASRNDLLDRLSANTFQEYKTQAIRMAKVQNNVEPEQPPPTLL